MNHLAKYLTMKIIPREYENDLDQIELAIYGMEGLLCNLSTLFVAIILSFIFKSILCLIHISCLYIFSSIPLLNLNPISNTNSFYSFSFLYH